MLSRKEIEELLQGWLTAWNDHDLEGVIELFHDEVIFDNWHGETVRGKRALRAAWSGWFDNHGGFRFESLGNIIDADSQEAVFRWKLEWPCREEPFEGEREAREGLDILHFRGGLIDLKLTYTKAAVQVGGKKIKMRLKNSDNG